ncbi:MAG: sigma-70 family RNA polymerase sigma factor [Bryobacterales bacterium]|nr:sigma-70 family RNA polymerase sigma factor [Bryobacterales bacterium]
MNGAVGVLPIPATGTRGDTRATKARVEYRKTDEADLVRRVQARDEIAFREVVDRYQGKVFSIIFGILRNHNDAEDIAQQVFAKVYFSINNFDFRSSLLTWIYKITVNECYDYLRKKKVRKLVYESDFSEDESLRMEQSEPDLDKPVDAALSDRDLVMKLLSKVSEQDRQLMLLKEVEGHSVEELAEMTGMNENTIKVKLFRARQKLLKAAHRLGRGVSGPKAGS